jgi:plasmid maintenance system antidote protein VapI
MLRRALRERRLTHDGAAELIGVRQSTVTRWLLGQRKPCLAVAVQVRDVFGVPVESWAA